MSEVTAEMIERGHGPDPRTTARRRKLSFKVRETREKLTSSGSGSRVFDVELLRLYAHGLIGSLPALIMLALAIAAGACLWVEPRVVAVWITFVAIGLALNHRFATRFLDAPEAGLDINGWRRKFALAQAIQGALWAMIIVLLLEDANPSARTFVLFVLLLIAAMTAMTCATIPSAVYCGLAPIMFAVVVCMTPWDGFQNLSLSIMAGGALAYFIILARRLYATSIDTLSLSMEKEALIIEIEQSRANSDEARRRAEEANLAKSKFLATMSHELRTPLNAILGFSEVLKGELFGAHAVPAYKEYSSDIHCSGQHLLMLINEILDLSRVEAGRYDLKEESVSLPHVVEECRHLLDLRARNREIAVSEVIDAGLPRIWADERALRQVTLNLLTNAIKFTPPGGSITIKVGWTAPGGQYLSITDTGPGIPPEEIPTILSSFGRGSLAQKNAEEGTGLGLPIVKGLVELHGGTFDLRSKVRVGTTVIVKLPPERVMNALAQIAETRPEPEPTRKPRWSRARAGAA